MSLSSVQVFKSIRCWSITRRLFLLYALSGFVILAAACFYLYWMLEKNITATNRWFLSNQLQTIAYLLKDKPRDLEALQQEIVWEPTTTKNHYYARVLNQNNTTLVSTHHMNHLFHQAKFPKSTLINNDESFGNLNTSYFQAPNYRSYLLTQVTLNSAAIKPVRIQLALDVTHEILLMNKYQGYLWAVLLIGGLVSALLGGIVAHRCLRPLHRMTEAVHGIKASELHAYLTPKNWPSELQQLVEAFNRMLQRLQDAFGKLSRFSADLAHELRTPINNLMGEAEIALTRARTVEDYQEILSSSLEEYSKLASLIEKLLFLAHAENPSTVIQPVLIDVYNECQALKDYFEILAQEKNIRIDIKGEAKLKADPTLFRRAISNLISNAIYYTNEGGNITIKIKQNESQIITLSIEDNGEGIDPEHLPHLFDRFYRVDSARSKQSGGSGLGLAIVKSIMEMHQGNVSVESSKQQFTRFVLQFPA